MKFVYVDESGSRDQTDVFVMCGLMIDASRLRKKTEDCEQLLNPILERHSSGNAREFKTSKFIRGKGGWKGVRLAERREFLKTACRLAVSKGDKIVGLALSISSVDEAINKFNPPLSRLHLWQVAAMFIASLVQKEMQKSGRNKGHTVFIMDNNHREMPSFSDELHARNEWFDGLYEQKNSKSRGPDWKPRTRDDRFDQIINTAFGINSEHATLIQVADIICYVYRRYLELTCIGERERWNGERQFYQDLFD